MRKRVGAMCRAAMGCVAASAMGYVLASAAQAEPITLKVMSFNIWYGGEQTNFADVVKVIRDADPEASEEVKWRKPSNPAGVPVWERDGIICTGETYKDKVKLTFARGASLADPAGLFNASLDAGTRRAIDIREGEAIDEAAFKALVREAVAANVAKQR